MSADPGGIGRGRIGRTLVCERVYCVHAAGILLPDLLRRKVRQLAAPRAVA